MGTSIYHLYLDDSGVRYLDRPSTLRRDGLDYFAFGGVLIDDTYIEKTKSQLNQFKLKYDIQVPLHSHSIRTMKGPWSWLHEDKEKSKQFHQDLEDILCSFSGYATACVVHRPGYIARYSMYGSNRWKMCKSAYSITVERAAKIAHQNGKRLAVYVEQSGKREEGEISQYHSEMINNGMPFNPETSKNYSPLSAFDLGKTLLKRVNFFTKKNEIGQISDLVLYPLVKGRYDESYGPYCSLLKAGRIIDCSLSSDKIAILGVKYYCFDGL